MQGSYKSSGLPRPYNMKPIRPKKGSPYNDFQSNFFSTPKRKMVGYFIMLFFFSLSFYWLGQQLQYKPESTFELEDGTNDILNSNNKAAGGKININDDNIIANTNNDNINKKFKIANNIDINNNANKLTGEINEENDELKNIELAGNMVKNSKGDIGIGVNEAPKGGIANEAPIVGNDEDLILKGKASKPKADKKLNSNKNDQVDRIINDIK